MSLMKFDVERAKVAYYERKRDEAENWAEYLKWDTLFTETYEKFINSLLNEGVRG